MEPNQAEEILEHLLLDFVLLLMYPKIAIALLADATGICNFYSCVVEDLNMMHLMLNYFESNIIEKWA